MELNEWRYYNHAFVPSRPPHEMPDLTCVENGELWKKASQRAYLARWTTDFDCKTETNWWYVIKDTPFDMMALKAKRRYEINKGIRHFEVRRIDPQQYREDLYRVQVAAFSAYPEKYRPHVEYDSFVKGMTLWQDKIVYGAFFRDTDQLCGYSLLMKQGGRYIDFQVQKTDPMYECYGVNAALVAEMLTDQKEFLACGGYICDGARSVNHETKFQDYLEKYFGFRKAYCRLHIAYHPRIAWLIALLYPFRALLQKLDGVRLVHQINAVIKMEEVVRSENE